MVEGINLKKTFYVDHTNTITIQVPKLVISDGSCLGVVGESGSGKSTVARILAGLLEADEGEIRYEGESLQSFTGKRRKERIKLVQMVFQTPQNSFDPRQRLGDGIMESLLNLGMARKDAKKRVLELLDQVGLDASFFARYPHQVSGGQCQRAAIARALACEPKLIICDEATSALDVSTQGQMMELLKRLKIERKQSFLFITHDLSLVEAFCDEVMVMKDGAVVEVGKTSEVLGNPKEQYTKLLMELIL